MLTKKLTGRDNVATELHGCEVDWVPGPNGMEMREKPGTDFTMKVDLVLLAMGFVHVVHEGLVDQFGLKLDARGNIVVRHYMASEEGVFAAGDTQLGASLVVRAISTGRQAAAAIDRWLLSR